MRDSNEMNISQTIVDEMLFIYMFYGKLCALVIQLYSNDEMIYPQKYDTN